MWRSTVRRTVMLVVVLAVAGIAWAAQPAPDAGVAPATPEATPEVAPDQVVPSEADLEAALAELFLDPVEVGGCCEAECLEAREACWSGCPPIGAPGGPACRQACGNQYQNCMANC